MSYIDTFDHELVAFFVGLPLYHPLEVVWGGTNSPDEFGCTPQQLVLGGGDGEHLAVILRDASAAVLYFLKAALQDSIDQLPLSEQKALDNMPTLEQSLSFPGWGLEDSNEMVKRCSCSGLINPYRPTIDAPLEHWLLCNMGEFIRFAMPELIADLSSKVSAALAIVTTPVFLNVTILPPGYQVLAGRYKDDLGTVVWGAYAWDTVRRQYTKHEAAR